jgi:Transposase domain (DUF772)
MTLLPPGAKVHLAFGYPAYHPATVLKIYVYGYLNRVQSSRRLERECQRNIELVWLTGRHVGHLMGNNEMMPGVDDTLQRRDQGRPGHRRCP